VLEVASGSETTEHNLLTLYKSGKLVLKERLDDKAKTVSFGELTGGTLALKEADSYDETILNSEIKLQSGKL
jgi:hypothetical protein